MTLADALPPLAGGAILGLGAAILLLLNGRICGIAGIAGGLLPPAGVDVPWRSAFVTGLIFGGLGMSFAWPQLFDAGLVRPPGVLLGSGALVGFGARLGSGCTSGHGVCGIGRLSVRSIIATCTFMAVAGLTVFVLGRV